MGNRTVSLILSLIVTIASGVTALVSYSKMVYDEEIEDALVAGLAMGENHFLFHQRDGKCFGESAVEVTEEEHSLHIRVKGWFALKVGTNALTPTYAGDISINPLGQVGGSVFHIKIGEHTFRAGTTNINPVTLALFSGTEGQERKFEQNIPGPFEVKHARDGSLYLSGPSVIKGISSFESRLTEQSDPLGLGVRVARSNRKSSECGESNTTPLDMTSVTQISTQLENRLFDMLPEFLK